MISAFGTAGASATSEACYQTHAPVLSIPVVLTAADPTRLIPRPNSAVEALPPQPTGTTDHDGTARSPIHYTTSSPLITLRRPTETGHGNVRLRRARSGPPLASGGGVVTISDCHGGVRDRVRTSVRETVSGGVSRETSDDATRARQQGGRLSRFRSGRRSVHTTGAGLGRPPVARRH